MIMTTFGWKDSKPFRTPHSRDAAPRQPPSEALGREGKPPGARDWKPTRIPRTRGRQKPPASTAAHPGTEKGERQHPLLRGERAEGRERSSRARPATPPASQPPGPARGRLATDGGLTGPSARPGQRLAAEGRRQRDGARAQSRRAALNPVTNPPATTGRSQSANSLPATSPVAGQ